MLATFVIGLREGLEAALIVGIVAAFLRNQGRLDLLRAVFVGVGLAIALCAAAGIGLELLSRQLPQRQQEGLETVVGAVAVGMVTYMVVWMRRHSRGLKGQLENAAGSALATGSGLALVAMAFLAVLREGLETAVFLLAAANEAGAGGLALLGAVLGIAVAVVLGYGIYRGGVRINLSSFFRATGVVLVLVAAGLVASALHTAYEAGWLDAGQQTVLDLSSVAGAGTVQGALLTGVLGIQPRPVLAEVLGWLAYVLAVGPYVVWPPGKSIGRARGLRISAAGGLVAAVAAVALFSAAPAAQASTAPESDLGGVTASLLSRTGAQARIGVTVTRSEGPELTSGTLVLTRAATAELDGVAAQTYARTEPVATSTLPTSLSRERVADLNGGRLPVGLPVGDEPVTVTYSAQKTTTAWLEPITGRVLDLTTGTALTTDAHLPVGTVALSVVRQSDGVVDAGAVAALARSAQHDVQAMHRRSVMRALAVAGFVLALALLSLAATLRFRPTPAPPPTVRSVRLQV